MAESTTTVVPFNPGEPYDYAKLNSLVTAISDIQKNMPGLGSSGVKAAIPVVYAGSTKITGPAQTANSTQSMSITFPDTTFDAAPTAVTVTPRINNTKAKDGVVNYYISEITKSGFKLNYLVNNTFKTSPGIYFDWIAVYMKPNA